ncbi:MAG: hypothetical protein Hyperionvirus9_63 [Hyperionvirus sp.]|uniref:Uncharacterized protein n=1 Tax=Hyperionvirus sp. TaxID=2487770 RepID=A0A3G5A8P3_9VIRU|nr:MAG: hypothetical protein Hyperionvirus9_63 [Hyperionvirus sp.]
MSLSCQFSRREIIVSNCLRSFFMNLFGKGVNTFSRLVDRRHSTAVRQRKMSIRESRFQ